MKRAHDPLTRINSHRQPLLHPRHVARAKSQTRLARRHVAQDVATRGPFGAEGAAALDVGFVDAQDDVEIVVAAWNTCERLIFLGWSRVGCRINENEITGPFAEFVCSLNLIVFFCKRGGPRRG